MNIHEIIQQVTEKEPLFTVLVAELSPRKSKDIPTAATDGEQIIYNEEFMDSLTKEEAAGVLLHETLHCAFQHLWRRGKKDPMRWNAACDYAINTIVNESFRLPKGALLDTKYYGMSAEEIYEHLPKNPKQQEWGDHSKWQKSDKEKKGESEGVAKSFLDKMRRLTRGEFEDIEKQNTEQKWKELFDKTLLENYGKMPDSIKRVIEKSYYIPVIDWPGLMANILSEDVNDYTFSTPDRRFMDYDFILPGTESIDRLKDVVFAFDTSGSIDKYTLLTFYVETLNVFNNFSSFSGWVGICDAALRSFTEIDHYSTFNEFNFVGGGGTNFNPVFREVDRRHLNPKALFYFTDLAGSFPTKEPTYPVFWLVRADIGDSYTPAVPFGTVVKFLPKSL